MSNLLIDVISWFSVIVNLIGYYLISSKKILGFGITFQSSVLVSTIGFIIVNYSQKLYPFVALNLVYLLINVHTLFKIYYSKTK